MQHNWHNIHTFFLYLAQQGAKTPRPDRVDRLSQKQIGNRKKGIGRAIAPECISGKTGLPEAHKEPVVGGERARDAHGERPGPGGKVTEGLTRRARRIREPRIGQVEKGTKAAPLDHLLEILHDTWKVKTNQGKFKYRHNKKNLTPSRLIVRRSSAAPW